MNKNTIRRFASCAAMVAGAILPLCAKEVAAEDAAGPEALRFERVWEGRNVFDADIPFPDGVTFVPGAEYRGEVRSLPAAMRIVDASGAVLATFAAPTNVAPPYTMHLAITGIQTPAVFVTKDGKTSYFGRTKFQGGFDPRRSEYLRTLSVVPDGGMGTVSPRLSAGVGQADVRFVTHGREGRPYIEDGRMYFTFSARFFCSVTGVGSLDAAHPERGVRFEGVVLYDYGDGLLRNDLAPHLFYDDEAGEWRGWACNFSTGTAVLSGRAQGGPHGRGWPVFAELPGGSPHRCILLTMDRVNFPGVPGLNWTYGGLQIYVAGRN